MTFVAREEAATAPRTGARSDTRPRDRIGTAKNASPPGRESDDD
jgi:hypothetical protein